MHVMARVHAHKGGGGGGWFQSQVSGYGGREIFRGKKLPPCGAIKIQRERDYRGEGNYQREGGRGRGALIKSHLFDGCFTLSTSIIDTVHRSSFIGKNWNVKKKKGKNERCSFDVRAGMMIQCFS